MTVDPKFLDIQFEKAGVRNSLKRLKSLVEELAVEPLKQHQNELSGDFEQIEEIVHKRVANVVTYWCVNKHDPVKPTSQALMSDITNARRTDVTLEGFYIEQVTNALHILSPVLQVGVPQDYVVDTDELEFALLELEEQIEVEGIDDVRLSNEQIPDPEPYDDEPEDSDEPESVYDDIMYGIDLDEYEDDDPYYDDYEDDEEEEAFTPQVEPVAPTRTSVTAPELDTIRKPERPVRSQPAAVAPVAQTQEKPKDNEKRIVVKSKNDIQEVNQEIQMNILSVSAEDTWGMIYNLMGYPSEYIQTKMLPRWQQYPETFEKDRRFLYDMFVKTIQNTSGMQVVAGNFLFADGRMTVDQLWNYYFSDLSQNVAPQLAVARLENKANETRFQRLWGRLTTNLNNISPIWLLAIVIALIFDGLTTFVSLDQTPMDGVMVLVFTVLITALFQIADMLVINYREREFEADAMIAKYKAKFEQLNRLIESLDTSSESYVRSSMDKSQAQADLKAAEDNRKMARRGRFWSARIADINVIVTAYGFAYMFLNAEEPMQALFEQLEFIFVYQSYESVNVWVFLMVGLAVTVSFVINTAQRTEILGWTMKRLKEAA